MIADRAKNEVQSTMVGEKIAMGVQAEDMPHIMDVLAGLYQNRLRAVIREYSTNALDAHVEAGFSGPVEVTLPSMMDPTFKVRDFGIGLDAEGIREVYSQYGRSTKRGTNEQTGMLGLGSKCALSYGDQFTVVSVKNGRRITVLVSVDEEGLGHMQILGSPEGVPTSDANGTEVQVAVRREDIHRAAREAADIFRFWNKGSVTVDGKEPDSFRDEDVLRLSDDLFLCKHGNGPDDDLIVMGSVAYKQRLPLNFERRNWSVVAFVPIGTVKPTPSREGLKDTKMTTDALAVIAGHFHKTITGAIQREVDAAPTPQAALKVIIGWAEYVPNAAKGAAAYAYKGNVVPTGWTPTASAGTDQWGSPLKGVEVAPVRGYYRKSQTSRYRDWPVNNWPTTVWVTDYKPEKFTAQHKSKLDLWAQQNNVGWNTSNGYQSRDSTLEYFVLAREPIPASPFIDPARIVSWDVIRKIKLPQSTVATVNGVPRIPGSYDIVTEKGYEQGVPGDKLRQDKPLFYIHGNRWEGSAYTAALQTTYPAFTIVCLPGNRLAKWKRDVPKSKPVMDGIKASYDAWKARTTKDQRLALTIRDNHWTNSLAALPAGVKDPALREGRRLAQIKVDHIRDARNVFRSVLNVAQVAEKYDNPLEKYPLYRDSFAKDPHTLIYLDAAYKAGV